MKLGWAWCLRGRIPHSHSLCFKSSTRALNEYYKFCFVCSFNIALLQWRLAFTERWLQGSSAASLLLWNCWWWRADLPLLRKSRTFTFRCKRSDDRVCCYTCYSRGPHNSGQVIRLNFSTSLWMFFCKCVWDKRATLDQSQFPCMYHHSII